MIKKLAGITSLPYFKYLKFGIYATVLASLITWVTTTYYSNINAAKESATVVQINKQDVAASKAAKEIYDIAKRIKADVDGNSVSDNLSLLDQSIIIISEHTDSSDTPVRPKLDSPTNDDSRQNNSSDYESYFHSLDNCTGSGSNCIREEVQSNCPAVIYNPTLGLNIPNLNCQD